MIKQNDEMSDLVMDLHNIARKVEINIGSGKLSQDIRSCADRLHYLINPNLNNDSDQKNLF